MIVGGFAVQLPIAVAEMRSSVSIAAEHPPTNADSIKRVPLLAN